MMRLLSLPQSASSCCIARAMYMICRPVEHVVKIWFVVHHKGVVIHSALDLTVPHANPSERAWANNVFQEKLAHVELVPNCSHRFQAGKELPSQLALHRADGQNLLCVAESATAVPHYALFSRIHQIDDLVTFCYMASTIYITHFSPIRKSSQHPRLCSYTNTSRRLNSFRCFFPDPIKHFPTASAT